MAKTQSPYFKGAVWIGLLFVFTGAGVFLVVLGSDTESMHAPLWVPVGFAIMFFNAGIVVGFMDSGFNEVRDNIWFSYLHVIQLLSIPLIFTALLNWVAFGPGVREFSGGFAIPFFSFNLGSLNAIFGRIVFGIPALILDFFILFVVYQAIKSGIGKWLKEENSNEKEIKP